MANKKVGNNDPRDAIGYTKYVRNLPSTEMLLRQFLKLETGLGKNEAYQRGHTFNFEFTQEQRDAVFKLMDEGKTYEEAFDEVSMQSAGKGGEK
jgi:hypothetical protein